MNLLFTQQEDKSPVIANFVIDVDNDMTKDILARERQLRTRTTVLQSNGKVRVTYEFNMNNFNW